MLQREAESQSEVNGNYHVSEPNSAGKKRGSGATGKLPNSVIRDDRMSPAALVLVGYACTFAGSHDLNEMALKRSPITKRGLRTDSFRAAVGLLVELGYLERSSQELGADGKRKRSNRPLGPNGKWARAKDTWRLGDCEAGYAVIERRLFNGALADKALAALIFLRAGTDKGPDRYAGDLAKRFGWSKPTIRNVLCDLEKAGHVEKREGRDWSGRYEPATYVVSHPKLAHQGKNTSDVKTSDVATSDVKTSDTHKKSFTDLNPSQIEISHGYDAHGASPHDHSIEKLQEAAFASPRLLAWVDDPESRASGVARGELLALWCDPDREIFEQIASLATDAELCERLVEATQGRIADEILSPAGLYAVRVLAAYRQARRPDRCGLDTVLNVIAEATRDHLDRRGRSDPRSLHSLGLIVPRLIHGEPDTDDAFTSGFYAPQSGRQRYAPGTPEHAAWLASLDRQTARDQSRAYTWPLTRADVNILVAEARAAAPMLEAA